MADPKMWEERVQTGEIVGRDPRKMTQDELRAAGHGPRSPIDAIRARCLDCCAGSAQEVRYCVARTCPSWPFRMGVSPWRAKVELSDAERERRTNMLKAAREKRRILSDRP